MKSFRFAFFFSGIIAVLAELSIATEKPQNIILFIGDGMGMSHVQAASLQKALNEKKLPIESRLTFENFPVTGYLTTHSETNIVTDSAAAGTALACGVKAKNGMIGKSGDGKDVDSVAVLAKKRGKAVGVVTSVCLDDATPSVFYAHAGSRKETDNILEQAFVSTTYDVLMGGGVMCKGWDDEKLCKKSAESGIFYVNSSNLKTVTPEAAAGKRVFGCFDENNNHFLNSMDKREAGDKEPRLFEITRKALQILVSRSGANGFFIMVEGGAIDKYAHSNLSTNVITEVLEFEKTISDTIEFLKEKSLLEQTLIVVTADHETGGLVITDKPDVTKGSTEPKKGKPVDGGTINMPEASPFNRFYVNWMVKTHTCSWVPLFATGPESQCFAGRHDNTDVAKIIASLLQ